MLRLSSLACAGAQAVYALQKAHSNISNEYRGGSLVVISHIVSLCASVFFSSTFFQVGSVRLGMKERWSEMVISNSASWQGIKCNMKEIYVQLITDQCELRRPLFRSLLASKSSLQSPVRPISNDTVASVRSLPFRSFDGALSRSWKVSSASIYRWTWTSIGGSKIRRVLIAQNIPWSRHSVSS